VTARVTPIAELRALLDAERARGRTVSLVPTMGALHEGHLSLVDAARSASEVVVVSIFVNPTQFGPGEDFERYPRDAEADIALLATRGADIVFTPEAREIYPHGDPIVTVDPGMLALRWEGEVRPGHFRGMATVVAKLLSIVRPDSAFFGEKDYQQLRIVEQLVRDLNLGVIVAGCPIVRQDDGLALSSRNAYLSEAERADALVLSRALGDAAKLASTGFDDAAAIANFIAECVRTCSAGRILLDYAAVVDPDTLEPLTQLDRPARALIAGKVGTTRLIDNLVLTPPA
jgi:pantoate--beta-alanine ligase